MAAIISDNFRIRNAEIFKDSFTTDSNYMAIGRTLPWEPTALSPSGSDTNPPVPGDSIIDENQMWRELIGAKRIFSADVSLVIPRYDWESGKVYDEYDAGESALHQKEIYTVTTDLNVYKCLSNNRGASSTIMPTGTSTSVIQTADGYIWKYIYTPTSIESSKFLTPQFVPVSLAVSGDGSAQADVQDTAIDGAVYTFKVLNGGSGYSTAPTLTISGDGFNLAATANVSGGELVSVTVTNPGSGYNYVNVSISGPGTGAEIQANISPKGGHGSNAIYELGAYYVAMLGRFEYDEGGDISTENSFRRISIIQNPEGFATGSVFTGTTSRQTFKLSVASTTGFELNEIVVGGSSGSRGVIVDINSTTNEIQVNDVSGLFVSESITGQTSLTVTTVSTIDPPEMELFSGRMLYAETIKPQPRDQSQVERLISIVEW